MLRYLLEKEFKQILRDKLIPRLILLQPLMMMLVMPWAANQEVTHIRLAVADYDHSAYSQRLLQKLEASEYFEITALAPTQAVAIEAVEEDKADIIIEVEPDFERGIMRQGVGRVALSANSVNGTKGSLGLAYLQAILADYAGELSREEAARVSLHASDNVEPQLASLTQFRYNPHLDYKTFMVPAMMVSVLTMLCGFLPALNIVGEKERGTIEQMNVTPVRRNTFIPAKLIPYWLIGVLVLTLCITLAYITYGLFPAGSLLTLYAFALLYLVVMSGIGLVISNYSETLQQATFVMFFFLMIFLLVSGLFTPVSGMPEWALWIARLNPLTYFVEVMRMVYLKGSSLLELYRQALALSAFALGFILWAILSYKKTS